MEPQEEFHEYISLSNTLNIRNIAEIHASIVAALSNNSSIVINVEEGLDADLSFVQLVESARREAKAQNKKVSLAAPAAGSVLKVLERAGLIEAFDREDAKFWLHKEVTA